MTGQFELCDVCGERRGELTSCVRCDNVQCEPCMEEDGCIECTIVLPRKSTNGQPKRCPQCHGYFHKEPICAYRHKPTPSPERDHIKAEKVALLSSLGTICGWAPGNYVGTCCHCDNTFLGDKHAVTCYTCAIRLKIEEIEA